ncbi:gamma-tubulin complex component 3 homolog [Patella vulgata]|uniref:gamma-tubulin complex component 3 homolog n=1 Tax=Patella vulgata TaxID=6465 RepID=UPI00217F8CFF|nr:gamma-tubulin complex component 3 homolog [Patella vulgata]
MASQGDYAVTSPSAILQKLCCKITGLPDDAVLPYYQLSLRIISSKFAPAIETDEFQVSEKIKRQLARKGREKDAAIFSELHRKLKAQGVLHNRWAVLHLLMTLSDTGIKRQPAPSFDSSIFNKGLPAYATSTPFHPTIRANNLTLSGSTILSGGSSGISSINSGLTNSTTPVAQSFIPGNAVVSVQNNRHEDKINQRQTVGTKSQTITNKNFESAVVPRTLGTVVSTKTPASRDKENTSFEIPENELLKDLMFAFQGIEGQWIKFNSAKDGYRIEYQAGIPKAVRQLISKLTECGWLYNKIKSYITSWSSDKAFGLVGQSFCAALHQELAEYYRFITVMEAQVQHEFDQGIGHVNGGLTLRRLAVWTFDPLVRLKVLAALVDVCKGKKGGALASAIYSYMQHGDPYVRSLIRHTLTMVFQPIYATLVRWIYDGELEDTYHEFFVASDPTVNNDKLWNDKYSLRKTMIPTCLSIEQARRILLTGKSINFLRQVCEDRTATTGREAAMDLDISQAETMFTQDVNSAFQQMIDTVYKETSRNLLDVFHSKYKFLDHLKAMRRYLLLGQGDFIRHLMDLLEEDLAKPASNLYLHNLTGILEMAIRATNAQYDDSDTLKRLDVRLLEVSPGDTGWDVFSLDYHVDGPIKTVFTPESMILYLRVFNFLWRAKRMEYILAMIWKNQISYAKSLKSIPELNKILHQCHILGAEMVHFIQQVQYYINFEVLECSWDELLTKVHGAEDLDHIIAAHQVFQDTVISRCLLDEKSRAILTQLRTIFDLIIQFQTAQHQFYESAELEVAFRDKFEKMKEKHTEEGDWAVTEVEVVEEQKRKEEFLNTVIPSTWAQLTVLSQSYQDMVQQFLVMLTCHPDVNLRFLSFRLDFNENYKARAPEQFNSPLMYQRTKKVTK